MRMTLAVRPLRSVACSSPLSAAPPGPAAAVGATAAVFAPAVCAPPVVTAPPEAAALEPAAGSAAVPAAASSGFNTRYLTIRWSMRVLMSELPVVALFQGIEEIGGTVLLAVVLDFLITAGADLAAILEREYIGRVLQVLLLDQHPLERLRIEAEGRTALQPALMGIEIDALEVLVGEIGRHIGGLGDRRVDPLLRRRLDVHVLARGDLIGDREVIGQLLMLLARAGHRLLIDQLAIGQQLEGKHVDLLLGLAARSDDVPEIVM